MRITKYVFCVTISAGILICACNHNKVNTIIVGNEMAEGDISGDSFYNGVIKFYDLNSKNLISQRNYVNNILNGKSVSYFKNGLIASEEEYENGKLNGYCQYYNNDDNNDLLSKHYFYYDIKCGNCIDYRKGSVKDYYFSL